VAVWRFLKETYSEWSEDRAPRLGAALAYYTVVSITPVLVIAIGIAGVVFGRQAVQTQVIDQIQALVGPQGADAVRAMLANAGQQPETGIVATVIGVAALLFGASGVFGELQDSLNTIWGVKARPGAGVWGTIKARFLSIAMVLGVGFLLLVSLVLSAALVAVGTFVATLVPVSLLQLVNVVVSFAVITLLFALIYKVLPDVQLGWRDVWLGAAVTSLLFTVGKSVIGLYLGKSSFASAYGAAGSLVVLLVWVYYSAQILFFGAEFTKVWARRHGRGWQPEARAERVPPPARRPTLPAWTVAALVAVLGFLIGRTPTRRLVGLAPRTAAAAREVRGAIDAIERYRQRRKNAA